MSVRSRTEELEYGSPAHAATQAAPGLTGNITEWKTYRNSTGADPQTYAFAYDRLLRLTGSERYLGSSSTPSGTLVEKDIAYDSCGRLTSLRRVGATVSEVQDLPFNPASDTRDAYGNTTHDAASGASVLWNILNLPRKITTSDGIVSEYTYLADGTKVKVSSPSQGALHYLGSMVFEAATPDGTPAFESLAFSDGRIVAKEDGTLEARYHITDHLGSVRTVVRKGNTVVAEHDYYPFGQRISTGSGQTMTTALRHTFSGKEDQGNTPARAPYLDFGARLYSADAGRWLSQDPLAEKYFSVSPYSYCAGNPVNLVDPEGKDWTRKIRLNSVTVSMNIYVTDSKSFRSAEQAAKSWNERKEDYYIHNNRKLRVKYDVNVNKVSSLLTLSNKDRIVYEVTDKNLFNEKGQAIAGESNKKDNSIVVQENYSITHPENGTASTTGAHEIGHLMGIVGHEDFTLMSEYQDEKRTMDLNQDQIKAIIDSSEGQDDWISALYRIINGM